MTSTTERPATPWPTRREREGGPARRARTASGGASLAERPVAYVPRHAALDPDVTERLPIVVPAQRSAGVPPTPPSPAGAGLRTTSSGEASAVDASPDEAVPPRRPPGPGVRPTATPPPCHASADRPAAPGAADPPVVGPAPAPWRPTATPPPSRPAVGSKVHGARPEPRPLRNGLGLAAACLGAVGLPFGLLPVTGFVAAGLGVLALAFGIAGWSRVRSGTASNRGSAVTGAVLGLIALGLGAAGTIAFVRAPDHLVYDLGALAAGSTGAIVVTPSGE